MDKHLPLGRWNWWLSLLPPLVSPPSETVTPNLLLRQWRRVFPMQSPGPFSPWLGNTFASFYVMFGHSFSVLEVPRICFSAWGLFLEIEEPRLILNPEIYWLFVIAKFPPQTIWRSYLRIFNVAAIFTIHRLFWGSSHSKVDKFRLRILSRLGFWVEPRGRSKPIAKRLHVSRVGWLQKQNNDHQTWGHCSQMHVVYVQLSSSTMSWCDSLREVLVTDGRLEIVSFFLDGHSIGQYQY